MPESPAQTAGGGLSHTGSGAKRGRTTRTTQAAPTASSVVAKEVARAREPALPEHRQAPPPRKEKGCAPGGCAPGKCG